MTKRQTPNVTMGLRQPKETEEPNSKFLMGLTPENCVSYGEPKEYILTTEEVKRLDNSVLRKLAAECENPDIKGKGFSTYELREYMVGQTVLTDFEEYSD